MSEARGKDRRGKRWAAGAAVLLASACLLVLPALPARTAPANTPSLGVSPPTVALGQVQPGQVKDFEITVFNAGPVSLTVEVALTDFTKDANGTLTPVPAGEHPYFAMSTWVQLLTASTFSLNPGEQEKTDLRVSIPASVEPGEKSMAVSFTTTSQTQGNIVVSNQVLSQVFAFTGNNPVTAAAVDPPGLSKDGTFSTSFQYEAIVRDTGNTHLLLDDVVLRFYHDGKMAREVTVPALLVLPEIPGQSPGFRILSGGVSLPAAWASYDARVEIPSLGIAGDYTRISVFPLWWLLVFCIGGVLLYLALGGLLVILANARHKRRVRRKVILARA
ncbi:MAG: hypothetical protein M1337_07265 [Actinobacteria bacterium]|nr:hypothetical protein [Actinomycetota bacterium]